MPEHTPGPWRVIGGTDILAMEDTPESIAVASTQFFRDKPTERQLADARLIAAAPDLLAALKGLLDTYACADRAIEHTGLWLAAEDAVDKAEGRA